MNPFIHLYEAPVETLTAGAYVVVLLGALVGSWWALGRNLLFLREQFQNGWQLLVPFWYAVRVLAASALVAIDMLLLAAMIHIL